MNALRLIALWLVFSLPAIRAQEPVPPAPKPPYVAPVPVNARWVVTLETPGGLSAQTELPTAIETIKTGGVKRVTLFFKSGPSQRFDQMGDYLLTTTPAGPQISKAIPLFPPYPFYTDGYLFVENVVPAHFKGVVKLKGVDCFYYGTGNSSVWISVDTQLPVAARQEGVLAYFQFLPAPSQPLTLPPEEAAQLEKYEAAANAFRAMR
ncbi:MAG: hypothetical protein ACFUZC_14200 [Chthoniobacteraceae bacterium]